MINSEKAETNESCRFQDDFAAHYSTSKARRSRRESRNPSLIAPTLSSAPGGGWLVSFFGASRRKRCPYLPKQSLLVAPIAVFRHLISPGIPTWTFPLLINIVERNSFNSPRYSSNMRQTQLRHQPYAAIVVLVTTLFVQIPWAGKLHLRC